MSLALLFGLCLVAASGFITGYAHARSSSYVRDLERKGRLYDAALKKQQP
jgi:hypothetical protein